MCCSCRRSERRWTHEIHRERILLPGGPAGDCAVLRTQVRAALPLLHPDGHGGLPVLLLHQHVLRRPHRRDSAGRVAGDFPAGGGSAQAAARGLLPDGVRTEAERRGRGSPDDRGGIRHPGERLLPADQRREQHPPPGNPRFQYRRDARGMRRDYRNCAPRTVGKPVLPDYRDARRPVRRRYLPRDLQRAGEPAGSYRLGRLYASPRDRDDHHRGPEKILRQSTRSAPVRGEEGYCTQSTKQEQFFQLS